MKKYTLKNLRNFKICGMAFDLSKANNEDREELIKKEGFLRHIGYSCGIYGCNGLLLEGETTNNKYVVIGRTPALWIFS